MTSARYRMFEAYGIEMEYMLVDRDSLDIRPEADRLLELLSGQPSACDFEAGPITWSNELSRHVVELKVSQPRAAVENLVEPFEKAIRDARPALEQLGLSLLPTGMHPWMRPAVEAQLWPHENREIYHAFDRIFNCRTHGWANVQSVHLNLAFDGDEEFSRLHAAARLILPLLPALAASSPIVEGQISGMLDSRLREYIGHCHAAPSLIGRVIPEPIYDQSTYRCEIFDPIREEITPFDEQGVFDVHFLNARGAIARFDRGSIELRLMDVQECPAADIAICTAVINVLRWLVHHPPKPLASQQAFSTERLRTILDKVMIQGEHAVIDDQDYLAQLGVAPHDLSTRRGDAELAKPVSSIDDGHGCVAGQIWWQLLRNIRRVDPEADIRLSGVGQQLHIIQQHGTLATRILTALGQSPNTCKTPRREISTDTLRNIYRRLSDCLCSGAMFV